MSRIMAALFAKIQFTVDGITYGRDQEIPTEEFVQWAPDSLTNRLNNQHVEFRTLEGESIELVDEIPEGAEEVAPAELKASKKKDAPSA